MDLYGLIHARFIITQRGNFIELGLTKMKEKYF